MANNQITPTFLNFANNVSLSQNKWNDTRLHQNKGCYYNNLLSPFWKKKESFIGIPFQNGNDVYSIENGTLYKNGNIVIQNISDGFSYDILSYDVIAAFSNYDGEQNYRFYRTIDKRIQIDFNDTVTDLNINEDFAGIKIIQIPTKEGYTASFGMLTILKGSPFSYKWRNIHYLNNSNILIETSNTVSSGYQALTEYVIIGGLVMDGSWAGFNVFSERGWQLHNKIPSGVLVNLSNLTIDSINLSKITVNNITEQSNWHDLVYVADLEYLTPGTTTPFWMGSNFHYENTVVTSPKTYFYFSKYTESGITINNTEFPIYGFEMWVSKKSQLYNSSLQIGNIITGITYNNSHFNINIRSDKIICPHDDYRHSIDNPSYVNYAWLGAGFYAGNQANLTYRGTLQSWNTIHDYFHFNFASSSYITENYQENIYCGYHKIDQWIRDPNLNNSTILNGTDPYYFSLGYKCGTICEKLNVNSEKTFNNLNPGDNVKDPSSDLWQSPYNFYLALGSDGTIQNVLTESGNALLQWQNIDKLIFEEKGTIYGKFLNNNATFIIKRCPAYIVGKFNNYLLINCDGKNAFNLNLNELTDCWAIGYNGTLNRTFAAQTNSVIQLPPVSVTSMPVIKNNAGSVNNHPEITETYFCGTVYDKVTAYNFADYSIGYNPFIYDIEFYTGTGTNCDYLNTTLEQSSQLYTNVDLSGQSFIFPENEVVYGYFLCNFSYEYYFNRFGVLDLGNNIKTNIRYLQDIYQITQYALTSLLENVENVFLVMGQIYMIKGGYIFAVILNSNFTISYQNPITECNNLIFCGNTSKYAFFFSPLTKAFYRFNGSQIFEYMQDASDVNNIITYKNNYYINISLVSYKTSENRNKIILFQNDFSAIIWEDVDDLESMEEGDITEIVIEKDRIYFVTTSQNVYSVMFYDNNNNFNKIRLEYESETLLNDFSQNIIDCIYINVLKKGFPSGKVWVSLISGSGETKQEFSLKEIPDDRNGLSLIRYQPKYQQRGRVAIRVESEVPLENIAYTVKPVGNEISHKHIEI